MPKSIITNNMDVCILCMRPKQDIHHMIEGVYRSKSDHYGLTIPVCRKHHMEIHEQDSLLNLELKVVAQKYFVEKYGMDLWLKEFKHDFNEKYRRELRRRKINNGKF